MKFERARCYSAIDAEQVAVGSLVYVADSLAALQAIVKDPFAKALAIEKILPATHAERFKLVGTLNPFALAYLVSSDMNAKAYGAWKSGQDIEYLDLDTGKWVDTDSEDIDFVKRICRPKEQKLRKFKGTAELVKFWNRNKQITPVPSVCMPLIWVKNKETGLASLITGFDETAVHFDHLILPMATLLLHYEFLDGTPCGVLEN